MPYISKILDEKAGIELSKYQDITNKGLDWFNKITYNNINIKSNDNLRLHAIYIDNPKSKKIMILSHGYRSTAKRDILPSCYEYYNMGFSLLIIDQRTCGLSEGKYITFGKKETEDLSLWVDYLHKKYKKDIILGGVSMGATTSLLLPGINNKVSGIIADSAYKDAYEEIKYTIKHYFKIPSPIFMPIINMYFILINRTNLKKVNTINSLENQEIPILFIHGENDDFVPINNSLDNYDKYTGPKMYLSIPEASHGMGYLVDQKKYIQTIKKYLKMVDNNLPKKR